jgi:hypothetical protein
MGLSNLIVQKENKNLESSKFNKKDESETSSTANDTTASHWWYIGP